MSIKEKGYAHWEGEFQDRKFPWTPITRYGIRMTFRKKFFKLTFMLTLIPAVLYLAGIYASERLEDFSFLTSDKEMLNFLQVSPKYFASYFTSEYLLFMMVMILVFCGAGLIADDLKYNSLQLYFSRPIKKKDYFLGKAAVIAFFLLLITLIPGLVFLLMKLLFSGSLKFLIDYPKLFFAIIGYSLFLTGFFAFYTLLLSSVNKNRRYVTILIFSLYIFSDILFGIFYGIFNNKYFSLLSIKNNLKQVGSAFFNQKPGFNVPWLYSFFILAAICVVSAVVLKKRVKGVEVVK